MATCIAQHSAMDQQSVSNNSIWEAIKQLKVEMVTHFDAKLDPIHLSLQTIQSAISTLGDHVSALEQRVSSNEDDLLDLKKHIETLEKDNTYLRDKVEDAENRSRAYNLRFLHVPEGAEGKDIYGFVCELLKQLLGAENLPTPLALERAHCSPTLQQADTKKARPRPILVKFLSLRDRAHILALSRKKGELKYGGKRIHIYPDFTAGTMNKRRQFDTVKKKLRELDMEYSLLFPATLRIISAGKTFQFKCAEEAESFLDTVSRPME